MLKQEMFSDYARSSCLVGGAVASGKASGQMWIGILDRMDISNKASKNTVQHGFGLVVCIDV